MQGLKGLFVEHHDSSEPLPDSRALSEYRMLAVMVGLAAVVALAAVPVNDAPRGISLLGLLVGLIYYLVASRRERRRLRLLSAPFPAPWRETLEQRVALYGLLSPSEKQRFESEIQLFLGEQRIYALRPDSGEQVPVLSDESRLLVAASAATLLLGRPEWRLPTVRDIVIYPTAFAEETYRLWPNDPQGPHPHAVGMVHAQGPILFSLDALERSFPTGLRASPSPASMGEPALPHVGIHEFAHVLDFIGTGDRPTAAGVPAMLTTGTAARWHQQLSLERERLAAGQSILSPYGLKNEAELFAVSVESFFQDALRMRVHHAELYSLLSEFFNQDPAARLVAHHAAFIFRPWFALGPTVRYTA